MRDSFLGSLLNRVTTLPMERESGLGLNWARGGGSSKLGAVKTSSTLNAIVSKTSNAAGLVNWRLYRSSASGLREDRVEIRDHQALRVWNKPNKVYTRQEFVESQQQHIDLTGEGWWVVIKNAVGTPVELWPIRPDRMEPVPLKREFGVAGYLYKGVDGEKVPLEVDEVIMIRTPNPDDPYRGMSPVEANLLAVIDGASHATEWRKNFFQNSAIPGGVVEFPEGVTERDWNRFLMRWREAHQGVSNAYRVAVLENGSKWVNTSYSLKDLEFSTTRTVDRDTLLEAYGIPKFALGIVEDVNRANAIASKAWFAESLTVPRLERFKSALNTEFLPMFTSGAGFEFDYDNPVPPDVETENATNESKTTVFVNLVGAGVDPDDAAKVAGLPPMRMSALAGGVQ